MGTPDPALPQTRHSAPRVRHQSTTMDQFVLVKVENADKPSAPEKDAIYESPVKTPPVFTVGTGNKPTVVAKKEEKVEELSLEDKAVQLKKMSDYKTFAKGLMDVALLSANTNQLRHAIERCSSFYWLRIALLVTSILLQILASVFLIKERLTCRKKDYQKCVKYNAIIAILVFLIIVANVIISSFGGPEEECETEEVGSGDGY